MSGAQINYLNGSTDTQTVYFAQSMSCLFKLPPFKLCYTNWWQ